MNKNKNKKEDKKTRNKKDQENNKNENQNYIGETLHRNNNNSREARLVIDGDPRHGFSPRYEDQPLTREEKNHINKKINGII